MTNADRIRQMSDEEFAAWVTILIADESDKLQELFGIADRFELEKEQTARMWLEWLREDTEA